MSFSYTVCSSCKSVNKINLETAHLKVPTCGSCHTNLDFHHGITNLNGEQVQKLIRTSPLPVVIDFWAPWCGPCRAFAPSFESTAEKLKGQFVFVKINTEDNPEAGAQFNVRGIPTIAIYKQGQEVARQAGAMPAEHFMQWLHQY